MTDLYEMILKELQDSKACHVERFPPYYICSIGAHLLNLHNKETRMYFEARLIPDLRLHVMFVAPPGGEKTFWMEQFLRGEQAILKDSGVDIGFSGTMTEAGFVGTIRYEGGEKVQTPGLCSRKQQAIVGIEEFSVISVMLRVDYSKALDPAMLGALDSGWVYKELAAGNIEYETRLTLWTATQPARFDLRGGMGRRLLFIYFMPTPNDWNDIRQARRTAKNMKYNPIFTDRIRKEIKELKQTMKQLTTIRWDEDLYKLYNDMKLLPYEEKLYDRIAMGYLITRGKFDHELYVTLDDTLRKMLMKQAYYRDTIRRGSEFAEVLLILRQNGGKMPLFQLKDELLAFGKDWMQSAELLENLQRIKAVRRTSDNVVELSPQLRENNDRWNEV